MERDRRASRAEAFKNHTLSYEAHIYILEIFTQAPGCPGNAQDVPLVVVTSLIILGVAEHELQDFVGQTLKVGHRCRWNATRGVRPESTQVTETMRGDSVGVEKTAERTSLWRRMRLYSN